MKKTHTKIIITLIVLFTVLSSSINALGAEKKPKVPDSLSLIMDTLEDIFNIVMGVKTDTGELQESSQQVQDGLDDIQTTLNIIESDLEGLNIAVPEQIPVILSQEFTMPINEFEPYAVMIDSDNAFEIKAVYVWYEDPDNLVNLRFLRAEVTKQTHPGYGFRLREYSTYLPKMTYPGYELLTYFDLSVNPTIDENSQIEFVFEFDEPELLDWDEELYLKIVFSARMDTEIECRYFLKPD